MRAKLTAQQLLDALVSAVRTAVAAGADPSTLPIYVLTPNSTFDFAAVRSDWYPGVASDIGICFDTTDLEQAAFTPQQAAQLRFIALDDDATKLC